MEQERRPDSSETDEERAARHERERIAANEEYERRRQEEAERHERERLEARKKREAARRER